MIYDMYMGPIYAPHSKALTSPGRHQATLRVCSIRSRRNLWISSSNPKLCHSELQYASHEVTFHSILLATGILFI